MQEELAGRERMIVALQAELALMEQRVTTIEHELHDGPLQRVIATRMELQALMGTAEMQENLLKNLEDLDQSLEAAVSQVRSILRGSPEPEFIHETSLDSLCREFSEPTFQVALEGEASLEDLEESMADSILRIVRELVWNARKHSGAAGAAVLVRRGAGQLLIEVSDQGKGFLADQVPEESFGLCTAIQRARIFDIDLQIDSAPGEGTRVTLSKALK